ncbi:MAG: lasso peptide biosynthesis B2 protein [Acidobacteriia bacterium]|nr:lasso peptide biosynthesis B2 protein [Terriglobia bacterium]
MNRTQASWRERWRKFRAHTPGQRALILRAARNECLALAGLRLLGFRRCKRLIERFSLSPQGHNSSVECATPERAIQMIRAAQSVERNLPLRPNCLERSLALWWMLRREGFPAELHIGARQGPQGFEAHAWVEDGGRVLNDSPDVHRHYARFDAPIAAAGAGSR